MKEIMKNSFYQLLIVYTILIAIASFGFISRFTLHFEIFALILGILGLFIIDKYDGNINKIFIFLALLIIFIFRLIPYLNNNIPLGYDAGLYKYGIEHGLENLDQWILKGMEPGFLYLMKLFTFLPTDFILIWLFIFFNFILGIAIYFFASHFNKNIGIMALFIYSVSVVQYKVFTFMYYKNIIGLILMLFSLHFLFKYEKDKKGFYLILFIVLGGILGGIHRPTFYIFGISYFIYSLIKLRKEYFISGFFILLIASSFYLGKFRSAITSLFKPVLEGFIEPGQNPGTFISFTTYQFATLAYLPFAILGFFYLIKKKQFNFLFLWTLINAIIVYFQFFFFNRFIIHLDVALIILAALGFSLLIQNKKYLGITIFTIMIISSGIMTYKESRIIESSVTIEQIELIKEFNNVEDDAYVISLSNKYAPFVLAYSGRKTIAPGLFDYDKWDETQWEIFWETKDKDETKKLLSFYDKPIYLFADKEFNNPCFSLYKEKDVNKIYKYEC